MSELRFEDVTIRYGSRRRGMNAVDQVSLTVPAGEVVGLVGESGSGKSTLARAAAGLTPLTGGRILLAGAPLPHRPGRRPVQMIFQDPNSSLDGRMTVGATIAEAIPRSGTRRKLGPQRVYRRREVARLLDLVELDPAHAAAYPAQLSGGQRQRVALARALAAGPEVVIADEITSALDVSIQGSVLNLVRDLQRELGMSMLFISHNLAVVRYVASSIAVMYLGRIVEHGPTAQLLGDPQHPYTRDLLAAVPRPSDGLGCEPDAGSSEPVVLDVDPPDPHYPPPGCHYHPRCPIGPLVHPDRDICRTVEPTTRHRHQAACHFAAQPSALDAPAISRRSATPTRSTS